VVEIAISRKLKLKTIILLLTPWRKLLKAKDIIPQWSIWLFRISRKLALKTIVHFNLYRPHPQHFREFLLFRASRLL
jgi:hypothetical protein